MKTPISNLQSLITNIQSPIFFCALILCILLAACTAAPPPTPSASPTLIPSPITKTPFILPPTWTPEPPTETPLPPTPRPTSTPFPTNTPPATFPPTPTAFPPVRIASADDHPFPTYNLIFLQSGVLRVWNTNGELVDLVTQPGTTDRLDQVQLFDVSSGGTLVAILRRNASGQTEIVLYDRTTASIRWVQKVTVNDPTSLKISPDNLWVAYATSGTSSEPGKVGVVLVEAPDQNTSLASCEFSCTGLSWPPFTGRLIWSDEGGVWEVDPALGADQKPKLLLDPPIEILNPDGNNVTGMYTLGAFSPSGRYLILSKGPFPEGIPSVFDTRIGRAVEVPGAFLYTDPGSSVVWLGDDALAVARAGLAAGDRPAIEIWVIAPETESLLVKSSTMFVGSSPSQAPFVLSRLVDGGIRFAMLDFSTRNYSPGNGVYVLFPGNNDLAPLNDLPFLQAKQAVWIPDASGVLLITANKVYYVPTNGAPIYDVDIFLGTSVCCYTWVP